VIHVDHGSMMLLGRLGGGTGVGDGVHV
jgi:hypothetical protein